MNNNDFEKLIFTIAKGWEDSQRLNLGDFIKNKGYTLGVNFIKEVNKHSVYFEYEGEEYKLLTQGEFILPSPYMGMFYYFLILSSDSISFFCKINDTKVGTIYEHFSYTSETILDEFNFINTGSVLKTLYKYDYSSRVLDIKVSNESNEYGEIAILLKHNNTYSENEIISIKDEFRANLSDEIPKDDFEEDVLNFKLNLEDDDEINELSTEEMSNKIENELLKIKIDDAIQEFTISEELQRNINLEVAQIKERIKTSIITYNSGKPEEILDPSFLKDKMELKFKDMTLENMKEIVNKIQDYEKEGDKYLIFLNKNSEYLYVNVYEPKDEMRLLKAALKEILHKNHKLNLIKSGKIVSIQTYIDYELVDTASPIEQVPISFDELSLKELIECFQEMNEKHPLTKVKRNDDGYYFETYKVIEYSNRLIKEVVLLLEKLNDV